MDDTKLLKLGIFVIGVLGVVLVVTSQTASLFSGQHSWYDLSGNPNDLECEKCHQNVVDELESSGLHDYFRCAWCHRMTWTSATYASGGGGGSTPGEEAHASDAIECMDCHDAYGGYTYEVLHWDLSKNFEITSSDCAKCHNSAHWSSPSGGPNYFHAGGFGISGHSSDTGSNAAHEEFVLDARDNQTLMGGANEACVGCHTTVDINTTHTIPEEISVVCDRTDCNWSIGAFSYTNFSEVDG